MRHSLSAKAPLLHSTEDNLHELISRCDPNTNPMGRCAALKPPHMMGLSTLTWFPTEPIPTPPHPTALPCTLPLASSKSGLGKTTARSKPKALLHLRKHEKSQLPKSVQLVENERAVPAFSVLWLCQSKTPRNCDSRSGD